MKTAQKVVALFVLAALTLPVGKAEAKGQLLAVTLAIMDSSGSLIGSLGYYTHPEGSTGFASLTVAGYSAFATQFGSNASPNSFALSGFGSINISLNGNPVYQAVDGVIRSGDPDHSGVSYQAVFGAYAPRPVSGSVTRIDPITGLVAVYGNDVPTEVEGVPMTSLFTATDPATGISLVVAGVADTSFQSNYWRGLASSSAPEPAAAAFLAVGLVGLRRRRQRQA